jgi:hypothetical protein
MFWKRAQNQMKNLLNTDGGKSFRNRTSKFKRDIFYLNSRSLISELSSKLDVKPTPASASTLQEMRGSAHSLFTLEEDKGIITGKFPRQQL